MLFWNRVYCQRSDKKIQNTQEVKENAFQLDKTGQNVHIFVEVLFFQATYKRKTEEEKKTINSLSLCQFDAGMLAEEKRQETDVIDTNKHTVYHISLVPFTFPQVKRSL